jgi:hypothetical protein
MNPRKTRRFNGRTKESSIPPRLRLSSKSARKGRDQVLVELKYLHILHENILLKMLHSKWLLSFKSTSEEEWKLIWTSKGQERVGRLKSIIESFHLTKHDLFPVGFTLLARNYRTEVKLPKVPQKELDFWRNCCNEIDLANSLEECAMFVQILASAEA